MKNENKIEKKRPLLLIELLETFSEKEMKGFADFVACPHFNTDNHAVCLLAFLKQKIWQQVTFNSERQIEAYRYTFPKRPFSTRTLDKSQKALLNTTMSVLIRLAEFFLKINVMRQSPELHNDLLYDELLEREQFCLLNRRIRKDKKKLHRVSTQNIDYYLNSYKIEHGVLKYLHRSGQLVETDNLPELNYDLDIFYLISKLNLHTTALSLLPIADYKSYNFDPMKAVLQLAKLSPYAAHPLVQVYQNIIAMMQENDEQAYHHLLYLLVVNKAVISEEDLNDFYTIATVFCSRQIVQGNILYNKKLFNLYQIMHRQDLLREGGFVDIGKLKNLVTVSCRAEEFEWAATVIEQYRASIPKMVRESVCHFNFGAIAFYQNQYKKAISHFIRVDKINPVYDINSRIMLLKSHYETDDKYDERTVQIFRSAEKFIHENASLSSSYKKAYKNFIRVLINLYRVRHNIGKMNVESLLSKLEKMEFVSDKSWLLGKMKVL